MSGIKGILLWGLVAAGLPGFVFAEDFEGTFRVKSSLASTTRKNRPIALSSAN
jgi:hypothetical protein